MRPNVKIFLPMLFAAAIFVFGFWFSVNQSREEIFLPEIKSEVVATDQELYPTKLLIPSIDVEADVQHVGTTAGGNMAVPDNFSDAGWFKYGTPPGKVGSAVMAGHVNNRFGLAAVFKDLEDLKNGDDIYVDTAGGNTIHFKVIDKNIYDYNARVDEVFKEDDDSYLKLITCTGSWLKSAKTHNQRLVVTALRVL